ncbi:hypothetical protein CWC11_09175 [Pseudoalteromonas sp. S3178]|uniref:hypothetical protein n=1 Tax=Pseudoalteromonas sp. S3178 TaxID=579532 RepID=UPI00110A450D|nr:hypothetical protein [Pseudoalteromonas sp. S3178]TMP05900.1 hypothetical protein CWC11_09175 [Pseudoalteromonas sp. S3178]
MRVLWPNKNEVAELSALFGFNAIGDEQDWEFEFADENRVEEFIVCYGSGNLSDPQKMAVMQLIMASFDDLVESEKDDTELWTEISNFLIKDAQIHGSTIEYWSCVGETEHDNMFPTTLRIRELANAL